METTVDSSLRETVFQLCRILISHKRGDRLQSFDEGWVMVVIRAKNRWFGLAHKCPLCQQKMERYTVGCQLRDAVTGNPTGKVSWSAVKEALFDSNKEPTFGICPAGHQIASESWEGTPASSGRTCYFQRNGDKLQFIRKA